jgi:hypothetical protein
LSWWIFKACKEPFQKSNYLFNYFLRTHWEKIERVWFQFHDFFNPTFVSNVDLMPS